MPVDYETKTEKRHWRWLIIFISAVALAGLVVPVIQRHIDQNNLQHKFAKQIQTNTDTGKKLDAQQKKLEVQQKAIDTNQGRLINLFAAFLTCKTETQCRDILKQFIVLSVQDRERREQANSSRSPTPSSTSSTQRSSSNPTVQPSSTRMPGPSPTSHPTATPTPRQTTLAEVCVTVLNQQVCVPRKNLVAVASSMGFETAYVIMLGFIYNELNSTL